MNKWYVLLSRLVQAVEAIALEKKDVNNSLIIQQAKDRMELRELQREVAEHVAAKRHSSTAKRKEKPIPESNPIAAMCFYCYRPGCRGECQAQRQSVSD